VYTENQKKNDKLDRFDKKMQEKEEIYYFREIPESRQFPAPAGSCWCWAVGTGKLQKVKHKNYLSYCLSGFEKAYS